VLNKNEHVVKLLLDGYDEIDVLAKNGFGKSALTEAFGAGEVRLPRARWCLPPHVSRQQPTWNPRIRNLWLSCRLLIHFDFFDFFDLIVSQQLLTSHQPPRC
jgi:hypothetical protein